MHAQQERPNGKRMGPAAAIVAAAVVMAGATAVQAQLPGGAVTLSVPDWVGRVTATSDGATLSVANQLLVPDPGATQEELPGLGHKFELFGAMVRDTDPENAVGNPGGSGGGVGGNEVISATIVPGDLAFAYRALPPGIPIKALTNQIGLKYYFAGLKNCGAGSPRVTLLIDTDGDGVSNFAAHGHVNPPAYAGCIMNKWKYEDLTDDLLRWEVTPGGAVPDVPVFPFMPWKAFAAAVTTAFPNHRVTAGFLLDGESCGFGVVANCGKAYYDLFTLENRTLEIWQDTVKK